MRLNELIPSARSSRWAVLLCFAALIALLCVQAFHTHLGPSSLADQTHCSICAAAHTASAALYVGLLLFAAPAIRRVFDRGLLTFHPQSQIAEFGLFSRPPPSR
jgi:hypothetical protein